MEKINLPLVDDHNMVREGLKSIFENDEKYNVAAEATINLVIGRIGDRAQVFRFTPMLTGFIQAVGDRYRSRRSRCG